MPTPVSRTASTAWPPSASAATSSVTEPPRPVNFRAFSSRPSTTRRSRAASARTQTGAGGSTAASVRPGAGRVGASGFHRQAAELAQVDRLRLQRDQPAGQPGDLEHVVDDPRQAVDLAVHHLVQLGDEPGIAQPAPQQVQAVADRRQGIAQLVAEQAEQLVLAARRVGHPQRFLAELALPLQGLGQVAGDVGEAAELAAGPAQRRDGHLGPEPRAVLAHPPRLLARPPLGRRDGQHPRRLAGPPRLGPGDCNAATGRPRTSSAR